MVRHGDPLHDEGLPIVHFGIRVERPGLENAIELDHRYRVEYLRQDPRLDGYTGDYFHKIAVEVSLRTEPTLHTVALVYMEALHRIAYFLRGYEPEQGEVVEPVYEAEE
jgi:hypothetical protein